VSASPVNLDTLLLKAGLTPSGKLEEVARQIYEERYVSIAHQTHDAQSVIFYSNRFEHAFRRDSVGGQKNEIDRDRFERIHWIAPLIGGRVPKSECWLVPPKTEKQTERRLYVINHERYIVWLGTGSNAEGWFSTAYKPFAYQMRKYKDGANRIWRFGG